MKHHLDRGAQHARAHAGRTAAGCARRAVGGRGLRAEHGVVRTDGRDDPLVFDGEVVAVGRVSEDLRELEDKRCAATAAVTVTVTAVTAVTVTALARATVGPVGARARQPAASLCLEHTRPAHGRHA